MSKPQKKANTLSRDFKEVAKVGDITEYVLKSNGLRVLHKYIPDTGVVTTNLTYLVGARDEETGETGIAHMLEHMLFKPTKQDLVRKTDGGAMNFERNVGVLLNANTWKDRTTYYFSYAKEHFARAIQIEAERMRDVVLTDKVFLPERTNVLSEFDMYNGNPNFVMSVNMTGSAFMSHPYRHETIGYREDIEAYTVDKLQKFYNHFYRPNNAVMMVIGDIEVKEALSTVAAHFKALEPEPGVNTRKKVVEPKQEGIRRVEVVRPGITNILGIGFKYPAFPEQGWFETMIILRLLTDGSESPLQKNLVDKGLASAIDNSYAFSKDVDLATIFITLTKKITHEKAELMVRKLIGEIDETIIKKRLKSIVTQMLTEEIFSRDSSLNIASELTEYVAAGDWKAYAGTEAILKKITTKDIKKRLSELFVDSNLTIGNYKSI
jgi:zinc protease